MSTLFKMVKYNRKKYPAHIPISIEEVAGNFDKNSIGTLTMPYSLHTEYSYAKRKLNTDIVSKYDEILKAQKSGIPQLWKSVNWAKQFADFIFDLVGDNNPPDVIEIHPPFDDYSDVNKFLECYKYFESKINKRFKNTETQIENRTGSMYHGGKFILSSIDDFDLFTNAIEKGKVKLKIACDIPQIYTVYDNPDYVGILKDLKNYRDYIGGVHLWGKRGVKRTAHHGDLNDYFINNKEIKDKFLKTFYNTFNDDTVRNLVLEVNSDASDLFSIIDDLENSKIKFI